MAPILRERKRLPPQSGYGLRIGRGEVLRIIDVEGEQVSDVMAFAADDLDDCLSSGRSIDYNDTIRFTAGHVLYSARSRPMFSVVEDTAGRHDFLYTPCSPDTFRIIYGNTNDHPSCEENLRAAFRSMGMVPRGGLPTTFNAFMNVAMGEDGRVRVDPPTSRAGDHIDLRAEMDLLVGVTACSAEMSNNYAFKPIVIEVYRG